MKHNFRLFVGWLQHNWMTGFFLGGVYVKIGYSFKGVYLTRKCYPDNNTYNEPRRKKTGLRGFRPGPTQTGLYKLRKELEA